MKRPLGKRVLVLMEEPETRSKNGLIVNAEPSHRGTVIQASKEVSTVKVGDSVLLAAPNRGVDVMHESQPHKVFLESDLIAIL